MYLDVEAALPLGGQRGGVEIELDPVHDLAAVVVAAVPLPLLAGGRRGTTCTRGGGDDAADEGQPWRALAGGLRQQRRGLQRHHRRPILCFCYI